MKEWGRADSKDDGNSNRRIFMKLFAKHGNAKSLFDKSNKGGYTCHHQRH